MLGLAPYLDPHRPAAPARWWSAPGEVKRGRLRIEALAEGEAPPSPEGLCGLAAPCSLPAAFLEHLEVRSAHDVQLTARQLRAAARAYAAQAQRGAKHPRRDVPESISALDPRRLPLFHAALPLLRSGARVVEVDPPALLAKLGLPAAGLSGPRPDAVKRRALVLSALTDGALGPPLALADRDTAIASRHALDAVLACALAAWVGERGLVAPAGAPAWMPLP